MKISIIVPCFNEEQVIYETHKRISSVMTVNNYSYEILYINDGSSDKTTLYLTEISKTDTNVKVINFSRNFGHQNAVSAGIHNCIGDTAIIIDADLQDPPEVIPGMIEVYLTEKCNVVYAQRKKRKEKSIFKKITSIIFYRLVNFLSDIKFPINTGDFRLIDKQVIEAYKMFPERNKYIRGLISWMGFKQCPFLYIRDERFAGETKYTLRKMFRLAFAGIFGFSRKPLKLALNVGFFCVFISLILIGWILYLHFFNQSNVIPGWSSTVITIIFLGGVQLLSIGVMGEYLGSIFDETKKRPEYIISSKLNF